jgi:hypothetical protein
VWAGSEGQRGASSDCPLGAASTYAALRLPRIVTTRCLALCHPFNPPWAFPKRLPSGTGEEPESQRPNVGGGSPNELLRHSEWRPALHPTRRYHRERGARAALLFLSTRQTPLCMRVHIGSTQWVYVGSLFIVSARTSKRHHHHSGGSLRGETIEKASPKTQAGGSDEVPRGRRSERVQTAHTIKDGNPLIDERGSRRRMRGRLVDGHGGSRRRMRGRLDVVDRERQGQEAILCLSKSTSSDLFTGP